MHNQGRFDEQSEVIEEFKIPGPYFSEHFPFPKFLVHFTKNGVKSIDLRQCENRYLFESTEDEYLNLLKFLNYHDN